MKEKLAIRQEIRAHLRELSHSDIELASNKICQLLCSATDSPISPEKTGKGQTISLFSACGPEVNLTSLHRLLPHAKLVYPLCHPGGILTFHHVAHPKDLISGTMGILEPVPKLHDLIAIPDIDVFLCPGLAFGRDRTRLGQGGGFYDRALHQKSKKATTVGIALQSQIRETVPHHTHDIHLDHLLTDQGFIKKGGERKENITSTPRSK